MQVKKIYLAGPISGASWEESEGWRDLIKNLWNNYIYDYQDDTFNFEFFSPLRGKDYLRQEQDIKDTYEQFRMSTAKSIMERDFYDVETCDAVVVNFNGAKKVSIGTCMEIAWAYQLRKPVIVIKGNDTLHDHSMVNQATWYVVQKEQEALDALRFIFRP